MLCLAIARRSICRLVLPEFWNVAVGCKTSERGKRNYNP